jgi:hypothetical protein
MQNKFNIMTVDATQSETVRGIPVVFGGDFAQTLPVVRNRSRAWSARLTENMYHTFTS